VSSLALPLPGQASLATVPPNLTQEFSITSRSSYACRLVAVTGTARMHARTEGAPTVHGTYVRCGELANRVKGSGTQKTRSGGRQATGHCHTTCLITMCGEFSHLCAEAACQLGSFLLVRVSATCISNHDTYVSHSTSA
jgi:hypothetical protein